MSQTEVEVEANSFEEALAQVIAMRESLTDDQEAALSKVLFPDTHTEEINLCGEKRSLRPLTIKYSKRLHAAALPFVEAAEKASREDGSLRVDDLIVDALMKSTKILAEFYGWEGVGQKVDDEDIVIDELQTAVIMQEKLQGDNDFLLAPLRSLISSMQAREVLQVVQNHPTPTPIQITSTTPESSGTGSAASTNSSEDTPTGS